MDFLFELVQISICILDAYLIIDFFRAFFRLRPSLEKKYAETGMICMTALSVKLLELVLFSIVKRVMERSGERRVGLGITLSYSIMPISLIGIMVAITRFNIDFSALKYPQTLLLISCIMALIGNVVIFYVFDRYSHSIWQLQQQELMITKLEMEEKHYAQIEQVNQEHAAFLHDVRHYMKAIGEMAAEHHDEPILNIVSELQIKVTDTETVMFCPNSLLNAILNEKKKDAEKQKIQFKIVVEPTFSID
ncbi:MAG: hypothetical protein NC318_11725 [Blautia sp.]|nr:hypothetical protein [Lachnoclostridium sp.]MCM1212263.1 hypothetical protein [Blautia sp.]